MFLPAEATVAHGVGQNEAVPSGGEVKHTLGYHKAHPEEQIAGWQERNYQQHQAKCQSPKMTSSIISIGL